MNLGSLFSFMRFFGLGDSLRALRYTLQRDRLDRRFHRMNPTGDAEPLEPGAFKFMQKIPHGAEIHFEHASLELLLLAPDVLRTTWKPGDLPIPYAIAGNEWPGDRLSYQETGGGITLQGSQLKIKIDELGSLEILDDQGQLLRTDHPPQFRAGAWKQKSPLDPSACIFGLGERACGWNLRPGTFQLWNQDPGGSYGEGHDPLYMSIPLYLCLQPAGSYLIFYENSHRGEIGFNESATVAFERGALRSYFISGTPAACLDRYTLLTGRPPMPPRWALGYHQSRWGYRTQDQIQEVVDGFREHDLPISVMHLDIDYMDGYRVFTFDPERYGDVKTLAEVLDQQGIKLVTIIDPGVKVDRGYRVYRDGLRAGMFCRLPNGRPMLSVVWPGWVNFPDFTSADVRAWWGSYYPALLDQGIAGIWHDMNEPTAFAPWGDKTFPLLTQHTLESQGGDHLTAHNLYALLMNRAGYEALEKYHPDRRPWLLSRAGFAGGQRYAWNWTGDVETSWSALRQTLATMLGVSLSGFAYTGSDVGGFSGEPDPELYLRWFQLGTFSPFFRTHSAIGTPPREPWVFEESILNTTRKLLLMRYQLMPYLYTLAWTANQEGAPFMRPMFWSDPGDASLWEIADQYFLGPDLLIAPVLEPNNTEREVALPAGSWFDLWSDVQYEGGSVQAIPTELSMIPVFIRAGAILPLEGDDNTLELHLYLPGQGDLFGELYSDAGDGYAEFRVDRFEGKRQGNRVQLNWQTQGSYPWPFTTLQIHVHGAEVQRLAIDGEDFQGDPKHDLPGLFKTLEITLK